MESLFGLSHSNSLLIYTLVAIILLIFLIAKVNWHPFISLLVVSVLLGMAAGMKLPAVADAIQDGVGSTLGSIAVIIGLGTMLGKMMAESGGADRIANTLLNKFGERKVHWTMMAVAFIVGIPVFFEVGVVLLIPLLYTIARRTKMSLVKIGIPMLAGLSTVHGLLPPHPAPMIAVEGLHANVAKTILYAIIVGLPPAIIAGPVFGSFIAKRIKVEPPKQLSEQFSKKDDRKLPSFGTTMITILLPVILMLIGSLSTVFHESSVIAEWSSFLGKPIIALVISVIVSFFTLGYARGFNKKQLSSFMGECLAPTATIILVIGAGGAFKNILITSGVGNAIADLATSANISPILFAWFVAALIRVATGSATVAMTTAVGIVAPVLAHATGSVNIELIVLAIGAGSLILSHVNDAGFWMVKEFFNMTVTQTLKTWTVMETLLSVIALVLILVINAIV
ncbi:MAG: permease DsdX [Bacillus sp. (in: Bacteria)]|nr:permease DsdX [Bacillus sp. (in: firmicutes)]